MNILNEKDIINIIKNDKWMMEVLRAAAKLDLPDWWISAGFVRNKIWDVLHEYKDRTPVDDVDVDVIYFNAKNLDSRDEEKEIKERLQKIMPEVPWSVKNQARMHLWYKNRSPYLSSTDALSKYPETATSVAIKISDGKLVLNAPHGVSDLLNLRLSPTPPCDEEKLWVFKKRISEKNWQSKWPRLKIFYIE